MFFSIFMIAAALAATILIGVSAGIWAALAFLAVIVGLYRAATHQAGPDRPLHRSGLNAFQTPLSDD